MLGVLFGYWLGKRAGKKQIQQEEDVDMASYEDFSLQIETSDLDCRSLDQLLAQARENARAKNNQ